MLLRVWGDRTVAEAVAAGRRPELIAGMVFWPDRVVEVRPPGPTSGTVVWKWHVRDHLVQDFAPTATNWGVVGNHPELDDINSPPVASTAGDWNHMNSIDYDPVHDWVVLSAHAQNEVWIIDHGTTTAEAVGHSGGR